MAISQNPLGSIRRGGHRRVMELDSEVRILILDIAKGILHLDLSPSVSVKK